MGTGLTRRDEGSFARWGVVADVVKGSFPLFSVSMAPAFSDGCGHLYIYVWNSWSNRLPQPSPDDAAVLMENNLKRPLV